MRHCDGFGIVCFAWGRKLSRSQGCSIPAMNADPIRRFEFSYLRPLWAATILLTLAAAVNSRWWWVAGGVLSVLYIGTIAAKLHPSPSVAQLSQVSHTSAEEIAESNAIARAENAALVFRACYRVAYLLAAWAAALFMAVFGWRWYAAIPAAIFAASVIGGLLIVAFAERTRN